MNELDPLDHVLRELLAQLSPASRARVMRAIGNALRRNNAQRIAANTTPDGAAFAPRKKQKKHGGIMRRGKLFKKLHKDRSLRLKSTDQLIEIGFDGQAAHIAQVNHYGLADKVREGLTALYPARPLLGITEADKALIQDELHKMLSQKNK